MRLVDRIAEDYNSIAMRSIYVKEWDAELFFQPLTVADMDWVETRKPKTQYDTNILLLIRKAKDEHGDKLFQAGDRSMVENMARIEVLAPIIEFMAGDIIKADTAEEAIEAAKEVLEADPT